jgi:hypothetical protein
VFLIKELSAQRAEEWAARLLLALTRNGVQVPENVLDMGMAGIATVGIRSIGGIPWDQAKPLLDEMMACVRMQPSPSRPNIVRALIDRGDDGDDIEEITTRITLREAWITLHTGFSIAGFLSKSREAAEDSADQSENGGDIAISPGALVQ